MDESKLLVHSALCASYSIALLVVVFVTVDTNYDVHVVSSICAAILAFLTIPMSNGYDSTLIKFEVFVAAISLITGFTFFFGDAVAAEYVVIFIFLVDKALKTLFI
jgi:hypothetical protein